MNLDLDATKRRNGRTRSVCPGCEDLSVAMKRSIAESELLITVRRLGGPKEHEEDCIIGMVLRELATRMLP